MTAGVLPGRSSLPPSWSPSYRWQIFWDTEKNRPGLTSKMNFSNSRRRELKKHIYFITNHKRVLNPSLQDGFRDSFGLLMPSLADHFDVGRAEAILTCSIMTLLTLGRYSHLHFHKTSTQKRSQYVWRRNILNLQWASSSCSSLAAWASSHHHGRCLPRLCR